MRRRSETVASTNGTGRVDSLRRGLDVLRAFRTGEAALDVAELARRNGLSPRTTRRLLETLATQGFVVRATDADAFSLHVAAFVVGQAVLAGSPLVARANVALRALADRFAAPAWMCVADRDDLLVVAHAPVGDAPDTTWAVGAHVPVADTALGHAWLWTQPAATQADWLARLRASASSSAARLWKSFQSIEEHGACRQERFDRQGRVLVASPLVLRDGTAASLGCACAAAAVSDCMTALSAAAATLHAEVPLDAR